MMSFDNSRGPLGVTARALLVVAAMIGFLAGWHQPVLATTFAFSSQGTEVPSSSNGLAVVLNSFDPLLATGVPDSDAFTLIVDDEQLVTFTVEVGEPLLGSVKLSLTGDAVIYSGQTVTVDYVQPTDVAKRITRYSDNEYMSSFENLSVTNNSGAVAPPRLSGTTPLQINEGTPNELVLTFTCALADLAPGFSLTPNLEVRKVTGQSREPIGITNFLVDFTAPNACPLSAKNRLTLTLDDSSRGAVFEVVYTAPTSAPPGVYILRAPSNGTLIRSFQASISTDTTAPALVSGTAPSLAANGTELTLTFDEALAAATPAAGAFTVLAGGSAVTVSSAVNSGSTSVLTLASAIAQGATVTVAYTAPQSGGIQDAAGNLTATFTAQAVTNNSTVPAPSSGGGSSDTTSTTVASPSSGGGSSETTSTTSPFTESTTPSRITADNQEQFTAEPGAAKAIVNGEEVVVDITNAGDDAAGATDPEDRTAEQIAELQDTADTIVTVLDEAAGGDSGLTVVDTETGAEIDGIFDDVRVPVEDVIVAEAGEFAGLYASRDENGNPVKIRAEILEMERGGEVAVIVYGLPAGEDVELVLMSTPYLLGTVTTDSTGGFTRMVGPPASVLAGDHTLVTASETVTVSLGIRITDPSATTEAADTILPATGSPAPIGLLIALIGSGVVFVMVSRRRSGAID